MNLNDLRENFKDNDFIPYIEFLKTEEWKQKRDEILKRDSYTCTDCGKKETIEHYDEKLRKKFHFSLGEDESVSTAPGVEISLPKLIFQDKAYHLEVHHKVYILNRLPWDYKNDKLTTLCNWCHSKFHENNQVTVYSENQLNELMYNPCRRCNGAGWFPEYRNVDGGVCFRCRGARFEEQLIKKAGQI